jgi:glycerophosphoryl diester phosphodiesterase
MGGIMENTPIRRLAALPVPEGRPFFVAHRGASDRALENSPSAFSLAAADASDMIEFDIHVSSDGVPVVLHDEATGRTAKENLVVARTPWERLRRVRLKNGDPLPCLAEVFDLVRGAAPLDIESKAPGGVAAASRTIRETGYSGELMVSSGLREECLAARSLLPGLPCGLVTRRPSASDLAFCRNHGLSSIHPDYRQLTVLRLRGILASGVPLVPWTVDDPEAAFRLLRGGAAGVFSNRAQALREAWGRRNTP